MWSRWTPNNLISYILQSKEKKSHDSLDLTNHDRDVSTKMSRKNSITLPHQVMMSLYPVYKVERMQPHNLHHVRYTRVVHERVPENRPNLQGNMCEKVKLFNTGFEIDMLM